VNKGEERVAKPVVAYSPDELPVSILHLKNREGVADSFFAVAALRVLFIRVIAQMHIRVAFIRQKPRIVYAFEDDGQVIAILEQERGEYPIPVQPFSLQENLQGDFFLKVAFNRFE
jgi:hypothetical protein